MHWAVCDELHACKHSLYLGCRVFTYYLFTYLNPIHIVFDAVNPAGVEASFSKMDQFTR